MRSITLFTETESTWFTVPVRDAWGDDAEVDVLATTTVGARERVKASAKDYRYTVTGAPEVIAGQRDFSDFD